VNERLTGAHLSPSRGAISSPPIEGATFLGPFGTGTARFLQISWDSGDHYVRPYGRLGASRSSTSGGKALLLHE